MPLQDSTFPLIIIAFVAVFIIGVIYSIISQNRRREELIQTAARMGLSFSQRDPYGIPNAYGHCDWFSQGSNQSAYNVIHGRIGDLEVKAFDYSYETQSTHGTGADRRTDTHTHYFSAAVLDTTSIFPSLLIRREGFGDRLAGALGFNDIDFESAEFSRKFFVLSDDKKFAYDVVHARMMEFLMAEAKWEVQLLGHSVIVYNGDTFSPPEFAESVNFAREFLDRFPEYLRRELKITKEAT